MRFWLLELFFGPEEGGRKLPQNSSRLPSIYTVSGARKQSLQGLRRLKDVQKSYINGRFAQRLTVG
jgi:hypothetical protein